MLRKVKNQKSRVEFTRQGTLGVVKAKGTGNSSLKLLPANSAID